MVDFRILTLERARSDTLCGVTAHGVPMNPRYIGTGGIQCLLISPIHFNLFIGS